MSASSRRLAGSRFDDGSSSTSTSGSMAGTVATDTRRRWPKLRGWGGGGGAAARLVDAVQVQDERRLAGAVRAEEGDALARLDHEVDAVQRLVAVRIGER